MDQFSIKRLSENDQLEPLEKPAQIETRPVDEAKPVPVKTIDPFGGELASMTMTAPSEIVKPTESPAP